MKIRFLADVNFNRKIVEGLRRRDPEVDILTHESADLDAMSDDEVLQTAARLDRLLLTHDAGIQDAQIRLMAGGAGIPGILIARLALPIGLAIEQIFEVWSASQAEEWINQVYWLPRG